MRKLLGYLFLGLGFLIFWPLQIGLTAFAIYYIVTIFIDAGVLAGIISIPIAGISLGIAHFVVSLLIMPLTLLVAALFGVDNEKKEVATAGAGRRFEMPFCPSCGAEVVESAAFCVKCGSPLKAVVRVCPKCGTKVDDETAVFCAECGRQLG